jgi:type I restriction enzyme, S subunit
LKISDYRTEGVPLVFVRHIRACNFLDLDPKFITKTKAEELSAHTARGGDLLITKMGDPPGHACLYPAQAPDAIITADCIKLTPSELLPETLFLVYAVILRSVRLR